MLSDKKRLPFTDLMIRSITDQPGVYALWDRERLLYLGRTRANEGLRDALKAHAQMEHPVEIPHVYDFQYEVHSEPQHRQKELLEQIRKRAGTLPPYNENGH